ncbi:MAG: site-specific integrase [Thermoleophilia bacterium]|nr:site-specific integrase [Thermoleophilia bacterium]
MLATLAGAGLRIGEACALDWRDLNLATGTLTVRESKTEAGTGREIGLPLGLADELRGLAARSDGRKGARDPVFVNRNGLKRFPFCDGHETEGHRFESLRGGLQGPAGGRRRGGDQGPNALASLAQWE